MVGQRGFARLLLALVALTSPAAAYEVAAVADGGRLIGNVRFAGTPPRFDPLPVKKDRDVCGEKKEAETLLVGAAGGVRNAVILVEGVAWGKRTDREVVLDNAKCRFVPHVSVVMEGGTAKVRNSDPILHNTRGFWGGKVRAFNLALPNRGQEIAIGRYLKKPGVIEIRCDAHTHMRAWIVVHDSPYFALTDEGGNFGIDDVPPGKYNVTMWHQGFVQRGFDKDGRPLYDEPRRVTREATIAPRASVAVDFELR
ncbi:MAG: hypothetical protein HY726_19760 [Candidatus Rokubacteria bacterium]|nr:hypothetical protein [Candidatus Rokubacteria bacterium]